MATANDGGGRRQALISAITAELDRQAKDGEARVNVEALADAVDAASQHDAPLSEGRRPEDLNSTNDG